MLRRPELLPGGLSGEEEESGEEDEDSESRDWRHGEMDVLVKMMRRRENLSKEGGDEYGVVLVVKIPLSFLLSSKDEPASFAFFSSSLRIFFLLSLFLLFLLLFLFKLPLFFFSQINFNLEFGVFILCFV